MGTWFVCLILSLVVGNQEGRVQFRTRMRKEDFRQRRGKSENIKTIGQWSQERVYLLLSMQAFSWASHLKHWILKMIVWHEMIREKVKERKTPR